MGQCCNRYQLVVTKPLVMIQGRHWQQHLRMSASRKEFMKITKEKLISLGACSDDLTWFDQQKSNDLFTLLDKAVEENHFDWANWMITNLLDLNSLVRYAIFSAEMVIRYYSEKYPDDRRPQKAIDAAKEYLKNPSAYTADAAYAAYVAADAAADAAAEIKAKIIEYGKELISSSTRG